MLQTPFYDPEKSYEENFKRGPFGAFADGKVLVSPMGSLPRKKKEEPEYNFLGFKVNSPFGIPAGPLINGNFVQAALDKGFDIVTYKTVRTRKYSCHPWPNVLPIKVPEGRILGKDTETAITKKDYEEPLSITNSFGVPSFDPEFWSKDIAKVVKNLRKGQILVGSFQRTKKEIQNVEEYIKDFVEAARLMKETGVQVMEVNFSCPNEGTTELLCYDVARSEEVIKAIKDEIKNIPLIVKISYYKDEKLLSDFVKRVGKMVQGISAINTIFAEIVDERGKPVLPGRTHSGVCGNAIKWAGLDMVAR
ncbi:MAG TPA: dihydroorotate oxidase, partial [Candidatus Paceibacterota bacterium]|nr:dihydroorotate oxidase [Candidatus Paceibacterota bacterium]